MYRYISLPNYRYFKTIAFQQIYFAVTFNNVEINNYYKNINEISVAQYGNIAFVEIII